MSFTVFLDIDGVLNSRTTVMRTPDGYKGIDDLRVGVLARALKKYGGGDVVLTSDWKNLRKEDDDYSYLVSILTSYALTLSGQTIDHGFDRGKGVKDYLKMHPEITEYVILDDNTYDFKDYPKEWERLLLTNGIEYAHHASTTPSVEAIIFCDYIKEFS